ncbi:putative secreted protein [Sorangium cellulosum So ce56]|uniref:Secreted protein n=2 Tax=Polyangiaceae TaxID=49 RepID=A9FYV7_SORC5|nr:putative secreted protein [Sorangium cellulosum So ce56]
MPPTAIMKPAGNARALGSALALLVMIASFGCDTVATLVAPAVPVVIEKATAPGEPAAPEDPAAPETPESRKCCFRSGEGAAKVCESQERCCSGRYDRSACEDSGGLWFNSADGCAGAC